MSHINHDDIARLAELARITVSPEKSEGLQKDFENILGYVSRIQDIDISDGDDMRRPVVNVLREDENPHEPGTFSKELLDEAPDREGDYIRVKKVL